MRETSTVEITKHHAGEFLWGCKPHKVLESPHAVRHTHLSPPGVQYLAPLCQHFPFAPWSSISGDLPLCAAFGGGQRQETVVNPRGSALFMENSCPPRHHVVFLKIWDPLLSLLLILLLYCSPFILSQTCIQLSRRGRSFRGDSRGRGSLAVVGSIYLAVRASHKAQSTATAMDNLHPNVQLSSNPCTNKPKKCLTCDD